MNVIIPVDITDDNLTSSTITEQTSNPSDWADVTAYIAGDIRGLPATTNGMYECIVGHTSSTATQPDTDVAAGDGTTGGYWRFIDYRLWDDGSTAYVIGDLVTLASTNSTYQCLAAHTSATSNRPDTNVIAGNGTVGDKWQYVFPNNKFAMFDTVNGTASRDTLQIVVRTTPRRIVTAVSSFNIRGATAINVVMNDPSEGEVYNEDITMFDDSEVTDWYQYYYADIEQVNEFVAADLLPYPDAYIEVTYTVETDAIGYVGDWLSQSGAANTAYAVKHNGFLWTLRNNLADVTLSEPSATNTDWSQLRASEVSVGTLIFGRTFELGTTEYGTNIQLLDFSRKETDAFGNFTVIPRRSSKLVDFEGYVETDRVSYLFRKIDTLRATPCVWFATGTDPYTDPTVVFGYYRDSRINIANASTSDVTIQIEGLV